MTQSPPALLKLANLAGRIDMPAFYERYGCIVSGKPTHSKEGREYACSCSECGGVDRASFWDSGRYNCIRGCHAKCSSPYWYLRDIKGYSHQQALEDLGIEQEEIVDSYSQEMLHVTKLPLFLVKDEPPSKKWQEQAHTFAHMAEKWLWDEKIGKTARAYLQSRGFSEQTIRQAHLGLCPDWYKAPLEDWGLDASQLNKEDEPLIKLPRGIVIPWYVGSSIYKIQLRRPEGGYFEVLGSSECLYALAPIEDRPVLLVESEFDALAAHQEASDLITAVATGGTPKARIPSNIAQLHQASRILQAFDDDEAGEKAAAEWQQLIPTIERWAPWSHDVNDMLKEELPIRDWVELGLSNTDTEQGGTLEHFWESCTPPALDRTGKEIPPELIQRIPNLIERVALFQSGQKICCDSLDWELDSDGYLICPCVQKAREANRLLDLRLTQEQQRKRSPVLLDDW